MSSKSNTLHVTVLDQFFSRENINAQNPNEQEFCQKFKIIVFINTLSIKTNSYTEDVRNCCIVGKNHEKYVQCVFGNKRNTQITIEHLCSLHFL